jgi:hypothetical protein
LNKKNRQKKAPPSVNSAGPQKQNGTGVAASAMRWEQGTFEKRYGNRCTLHAARCTLHAARCTLHAARCTLHAARCTLHA